ncbi:MAG TPA: serine/threonine-protein kinase [Thermoanaerobaculia bacterium]|nr:serine/threonine-protein kinase [Thermoanaerobaculia bacterium]
MTIAQENQQLGAFRLLHLIGTGGMGEVWLAEDTRLLRNVAIKILPHDIASDPEARARLTREAQIAARINHPSIATVHAIEEHRGFLYLAMEFVEGRPLGAAIRGRELSEYDIVRIARDIADALAEAHARGIVHRDIKPDNVMVSGKRVKVLDFGIAKQIGNEAPAPGQFQTEAGMVVGTLEYMSPEQALGKPIDARSDIFSLGVLLYEALAGNPPFSGSSPTELMLRICRDEPKPFATVRPDLPKQLADTISRCLEKDRERRFQSAVEVSAALDAVLPRLSRTPLPITPTVMLSAAPAAKEEVKAPEPEVVFPYAGKRMLIADDDPAIRRLFETLAKRERIECDAAANGPEAIAALKQHDYSLVFLDIMMPRIDGWGVLDYLRARSKARIPSLFIITAFLDQSVSAADAEIVSGIIYKPVDADDIAALMRECARDRAVTGVLQRTRHRLIAAVN